MIVVVRGKQLIYYFHVVLILDLLDKPLHYLFVRFN
jgi:hypothetical protein